MMCIITGEVPEVPVQTGPVVDHWLHGAWHVRPSAWCLSQLSTCVLAPEVCTLECVCCDNERDHDGQARDVRWKPDDPLAIEVCYGMPKGVVSYGLQVCRA